MGSASLLAYTQGTEKQTRSDTSKPFEKNRRSILSQESQKITLVSNESTSL